MGNGAIQSQPMHEGSAAPPDSLPQRGARFALQKAERPLPLSDPATDVLLFQNNIQALQKPPSCWPRGHLELPAM